MKKIICSFILFPFLNGMILHAQTNLPLSSSPGSVTPLSLPSYYPDVSSNYVRIFTSQKAIQDSSLINLSAAATDISASTVYYDQLGRPIETVIHQASPSLKDAVAPVLYDEFGRQSVNYIPYAAQTGNTNDGKFKTQVFKGDSSYNRSMFPNDQVYYSQSFSDGSPLNRPVKLTAPGNSWGGAGIGIIYSQRANTVSDSVRLWTIPISTENDLPVTASTYNAGSLQVQQVTDERGIKIITYTDELGRKVLTKMQIASSPGTAHVGWLCTYYVYDEMNHFRFVIPPKAVDALNTATQNWVVSSGSTINTGLCYAYFYDNRGRILMKRIPGKGKIYFVYDMRDRLVMTQDSNNRAGNYWLFTKYDLQDRPDTSGIINTTSSQSTLASGAATSTNFPPLLGGYTVTGIVYYDDYSWITGSGCPFDNTLVTSNINSINFITTYNTSPTYAQQIIISNRTRGMVTGTKKLIIYSSTNLYSVNIYDDHSRNIQTKQTNYSGGTDIATVQYSFGGRVLRSHLKQQKSGANTQTHTLLTKYAYDASGRVTSLIKNIDSSFDRTIASYTYNESSQLMTKAIGNSVESQTYTYNIRGWLKGINKNYTNTSGNTSNYFGEEIDYDSGFTVNQVNGNIAGIKWKAAGDGIERAYGFAYDDANRLTKADFSQIDQGGSSWTTDKIDFSVNGITYDDNGNLLSMKQRGNELNSMVTIDSLTYTYPSNNNQLQKVSDAVTDNTALGDFKDSSLSTDYAYDVNGNTTIDYNRRMYGGNGGNGATYNYLNKPDQINIARKGQINYYYDASGVTVSKVVKDSTGSIPITQTWLYIAGFVYMNDTLQYALQEEGRIRRDTIHHIYTYDYFLKDHLGNVRTMLTEEKDTDFYPAATMELNNAASDTLYYDNIATTRVADSTVSGYPSPADTTYSNPNKYCAHVVGTGNKIGPSITLRVMAGDIVNLHVNEWYKNYGRTPGTPVSPIPDIVAALESSVPFAAASAAKSLLQSELTSPALSPGVTNFLNSRDSSTNTAKPLAYLNWVLFDDQFNIVMTGDGNNSGFIQVGTTNTYQSLNKANLSLTKSGYLYVYVSNETPNIDVYFDNLQVTHMRSPLLQEQSYYPFGLTAAAISGAAAGKLVDKYKYNGGGELEDDIGLNYYNTMYRKYDAQIGRFNGIDPLAEQTGSLSPYHFGANNPTNANDPTGALINLENLKPAHGTYTRGYDPDASFQNNDQGDGFFVGSEAGGGGSGGDISSDYSSWWNSILSKADKSGSPISHFQVGTANNGNTIIYETTGAFTGGIYTISGSNITPTVDYDGAPDVASKDPNSGPTSNETLFRQNDGTYLNAEQIAYLALSNAQLTLYGLQAGDLVMIENPNAPQGTVNSVFAIIGDDGVGKRPENYQFCEVSAYGLNTIGITVNNGSSVPSGAQINITIFSYQAFISGQSYVTQGAINQAFQNMLYNYSPESW